MSKFERLYTQEGENLTDIPWNVYPRPQMKRASFLCLNGKWDYAVTEGGTAPQSYSKKITVPFSPETLLSGVCEVYDEKDCMWYRREFVLPEGFRKDRVLLHFCAVDNMTDVFVNGKLVGSHMGGYDPFYFDITDVLQSVNILVVKVKDILSSSVMPYGKQRCKRGGMWYTPTSGIWQTVWLESVPQSYIKRLEVETDDGKVTVKAEGIENATIYVNADDGIKLFALENGVCHFELENIREWSPESPYLYYFTVESASDRVESYFAFRTLEIKEIDGYQRLCLNGKPYFFHGLLDQGYWSDGGLTPPSPLSYEKDIIAMKSLGFNMLRKHIKIECPQFYYDCDRLGMVVFQDMINNGKYSFLRDTALPTAGLKSLNDRFLHLNKETRKTFVEYMNRTVALLKHYPCICCWTIFNEGWGQFCGTQMYDRLKKLDRTRFIDTASGWFSGAKTDVDSQHVYFRKVKLKSRKKPLVLSEFGGYSYRVEGHIFNIENEYGYAKYKTRKEFVKAFCALYENEILPLVKKGLCASVYTQVSDVEDETNGLFTYDRQVLKITPEEFSQLSDKLKNM